MKKTKLVLTSVLLTGIVIFIVYTFKEFDSQRVKERIKYDFEVIETKKNQGFQDGPEYYSLVKLSDSDYLRLSKDWQPQPSSDFDKGSFLNVFSEFSDVKTYKKIENSEFLSFSIYVDRSNKRSVYEYYFFMGDGMIATYIWID